MTDILFYHLQHQKLEAALVPLLQKSLAKGWRAVVQLVTEERMSLLDDYLWTFAEDSFLAHGLEHAKDAANQPVLLTLSDSNTNQAQIRFLAEGAALPASLESYKRIVILFDGRDDEQLNFARQQWKSLDQTGIERTYWQQDAEGRWNKKA